MIRSVMPEGGACHDWNSETTGAFTEDLFHRRAVGTRFALAEATQDDRGSTRKMTAHEKRREHPVDAVGTLADVLQPDGRSLGYHEPSCGGHGLNKRHIAPDHGSPRLALHPDVQTGPGLARTILQRRNKRGSFERCHGTTEPGDV